MSRVRDFRREVWEVLSSAPDLPRLLETLRRFPPRKLVSSLIGAFCHREEVVRWRAILSLGPTVARIAEEDLEAARVVIRRLMWMLNEESGGMAWGAPEGMAECLYHHPRLSEEYTSILVSYLRPDGNMLEYPPAQRGVAWGIGRLAERERERLLTFRAHEYLKPLLSSPDFAVAGLSAWALGRMAPFPEQKFIIPRLEALLSREEEIFFYDGNRLSPHPVRALAKEALELMGGG